MHCERHSVRCCRQSWVSTRSSGYWEVHLHSPLQKESCIDQYSTESGSSHCRGGNESSSSHAGCMLSLAPSRPHLELETRTLILESRQALRSGPQSKSFWEAQPKVGSADQSADPPLQVDSACLLLCALLRMTLLTKISCHSCLHDHNHRCAIPSQSQMKR